MHIEECKPPNNPPPLQLAIQSVEYVEENRTVGLLFRGMKWVGGFFPFTRNKYRGKRERPTEEFLQCTTHCYLQPCIKDQYHATLYARNTQNYNQKCTECTFKKDQVSKYAGFLAYQQVRISNNLLVINIELVCIWRKATVCFYLKSFHLPTNACT